MSDQKTFLIMAGGTGGHVFPALAAAAMLQAQNVKVHWLGSQGGMEVELVGRAGLPISCITVSGLRGKGKWALLAAPFQLLRALWQAISVIRAVNPDVVLGMGGFVTGPGGLAARIMRKPLFIHEQNAVAGLTNRLLAKIANGIMEAFPGSFPRGTKTLVTGNPVRIDICQLADNDLHEDEPRPVHVLVVGGSLGAVAINSVVPDALKLIPAESRPEVLHQAGKNNLAATVAGYERAGVTAEVLPFISDMKSAYGWADIVICRAGALTISELCVAGVGAILVPYPHAVDDHQTLNAGYMVASGAAELLPQPALTAAYLSEKLKYLIENRNTMRKMAQAARRLAKPNATKEVVSYCMGASHG